MSPRIAKLPATSSPFAATGVLSERYGRNPECAKVMDPFHCIPAKMLASAGMRAPFTSATYPEFV